MNWTIGLISFTRTALQHVCLFMRPHENDLITTCSINEQMFWNEKQTWEGPRSPFHNSRPTACIIQKEFTISNLKSDAFVCVLTVTLHTLTTHLEMSSRLEKGFSNWGNNDVPLCVCVHSSPCIVHRQTHTRTCDNTHTHTHITNMSVGSHMRCFCKLN